MFSCQSEHGNPHSAQPSSRYCVSPSCRVLSVKHRGSIERQVSSVKHSNVVLSIPVSSVGRSNARCSTLDAADTVTVTLRTRVLRHAGDSDMRSIVSIFFDFISSHSFGVPSISRETLVNRIMYLTMPLRALTIEFSFP